MKGLYEMRILFVCTGNTCRSPMAQAMFQKMLDDEGAEDVFVSSAGTAVYEPDVASPKAVQVMNERGLDISGHKSRQIQDEDVQMSDYIVVMTENQYNLLIDLYPNYADKIYKLASFSGTDKDIYDPFGKGIEEYRKCAEQIHTYLEKMYEKIISDR